MKRMHLVHFIFINRIIKFYAISIPEANLESRSLYFNKSRFLIKSLQLSEFT
jgi:hypothetical protein